MRDYLGGGTLFLMVPFIFLFVVLDTGGLRKILCAWNRTPFSDADLLKLFVIVDVSHEKDQEIQ